METPILINPSQIKHDKLWACVKTALISLIWIPLTAAGTFVLVDYKMMNKPIKVIERAAFYNSGGQRIYVTEDMEHWFLSDDSATKLIPEKERDGNN